MLSKNYIDKINKEIKELRETFQMRQILHSQDVVTVFTELILGKQRSISTMKHLYALQSGSASILLYDSHYTIIQPMSMSPTLRALSSGHSHYRQIEVLNFEHHD